MSSSTKYPATFIEMFSSLIRARDLVIQMIRRDVLVRYRGSVLGLAWSFFNPLIMLAIYTVVFSTIFKAKFGIGSDGHSGFALALFVGLIMHGILSECLVRSPSLIVGNINYVKKVVFPLEVFPWVMMGATLFHTLISLVVWLLFYFFVNQSLHWTILFLPIVVFPLLLFSTGLSWLLASLGVYLRDVGQITGVISTVFLFLSPIFYPASMLPEPYQTLIYINPLTFIIEQSRAVLMLGEIPDFMGLMIAYVVSIFMAWLGFAWFQKTRKGFADVL